MKRSSHGQHVLGIDIGRVLIEGDGPDTNFLRGSDAEALRAPAMPGAFEAVRRLVAQFEGRVWLVSKCGPKIQERSRRWLDRNRFWQETGVRHGNLRFCRERREKAPICLELGVTVFVDDRLDVLDAMGGIVPYRFQFGAWEAPAGIVAVPTWPEAEAAIAGLGAETAAT